MNARSNRAARIAVDLEGVSYLHLLPPYDSRRTSARLWIAHLEPDVAATLALMARDYGCTEEALVYRVWGDAVERWIQGEGTD